MIDYVVNGAVGVSVLNLRAGRNYLPYIASLKDRVIKYIDFFYFSSNGYDIDGNVISANPFDNSLSLVEKDTTNLVVDNVSAVEYCPFLQVGQRKFVGYKLDLPKSYITTDSFDAGNNAFLVFYYEDDKGYPTQATAGKAKLSTSVVNFGVGTMNFFKDNRTLADKRFTQIYPSFSVFTQQGEQSILSPTAWGSMFVNLVRDNNIFVKNVPLYLLQTGYDFWYGNIVFDGVQIDFTNSFLQTCSAQQAYFNGYPVVLGFKYND